MRADSEITHKVRQWPRRLIRVFGVMNLGFAGVGSYALVYTLKAFRAGHHGHEQHLAQAYYTMTIVSAACLVSICL